VGLYSYADAMPASLDEVCELPTSPAAPH